MKISKVEVSYDPERAPKDLLNQPAKVSHCSKFLEAENLDLVSPEGNLLAVVRSVDKSVSANARRALKSIKYAASNRLGGVIQSKSTVRTFGFQPSNGVYRSYCGVTGLFSENKKAFFSLCAFAEVASDFLKEHFPDAHDHALRFLKSEISPDWVLPNSVFTGGIANKNNPITYHTDSANVKGSLAVMLSLRERSARGGWLCFPGANLRLKMADSTLIAFPNTDWFHGVTPIDPDGGDRYSAVWYTNKKFKRCSCASDELEKARKAATKTAINRTNRGADG